ncbi:hypothetical protein DL93DRAFT_263190 [Clavulina sp. PMI_390]|nr:hypothetical protein DL93DRAFT_263190 [Clavulina sp. PMI_390]
MSTLNMADVFEGRRPISPSSTLYSTQSETTLCNPTGDRLEEWDDPRAAIVARTHFDELNLFLESAPEKKLSNYREDKNSRTKIARLTFTQFQELSMDVYDGILSRRNGSPMAKITNPGEFTRRDEARKKLAALSLDRLEDLASDVVFELARRYPEIRGL